MTLYRDILTIIFCNDKNLEYFNKYYSSETDFEAMRIDWARMNPKNDSLLTVIKKDKEII